jgi:hypothetical protein
MVCELRPIYHRLYLCVALITLITTSESLI